MDPWYHGEDIYRFLEHLDDNNKDGLILSFRDGGKSGMVTQPRPAWWLARNRFGRVLVANAAEQKANAMARASSKIMTENYLYKKAFPEVLPTERWGSDGYYLQTDIVDELSYSERIDPSLGSYGIRGNITGAHPDLGIILDDLISQSNADSPEEVKKAGQFVREVMRCATSMTQVLMVNTRWTYFDYCGEVEKGEIQGKKGRFEVLKLGVTRKKKNPNTHKIEEHITWPKATYIDAQGQPVVAGWDWDMIEAAKKTAGNKFPALYYNDPVMSDNLKFRLEHIQTFQSEHSKGFLTGPISRVTVELAAGHKLLIDTFRDKIKQENRKMPLHYVTPSNQGKHDKIMAVLQSPIAEGKFHCRRDLLERDDSFGEEIRTFPKGYDDVLDAVTYCYLSCVNDPFDEEFPKVHICCDLASTEEEHSDYTAIAAGCRYLGEFYLLDVHKIQSQHTDVIIRLLFNVYDKYDKLAYKDQPDSKKRLSGYGNSSSGRRRRGRRGRRVKDSVVEMDDSYLSGGREEWENQKKA